MGIATNRQTRTRRLNLRATPKQEHLIRVAAERQGINITDFILDSACEKAEQALADQTHFVIDEEQWALFMKALDAPPRVIPQIKRLFSELSVAESR